MRRDAPALPDAVVAMWRHTPRRVAPVTILPDGCRDLIVLRRAGERPQWFVSPLMDGVQHGACRPGEVWLGFRFKPGVVLQESVLVSAVSELDAEDPSRAWSRIDELVRVDARVEEALARLAECESVVAAARGCGMSERNLERLVMHCTGRRPIWWKQLARVRRAARAVGTELPLADVALESGYADQGHMTRTFRRWFGVTPSQLRRDAALLALSGEAGFA